MLRATPRSLFPQFFASRNEFSAVRIQHRTRMNGFFAPRLRRVKSIAETAMHVFGGERSVKRRLFSEREIFQHFGFGERTCILSRCEKTERKRRGGIGVLEEQRGRRVHNAHRIGAMAFGRNVGLDSIGATGRAQRSVVRIPPSQRLVPHFSPPRVG